MNRYKVLYMNCQMPQVMLVDSYDMVGAIQITGIIPASIIKIELIDSIDIVDNTNGLG